MTDDGFKIGDTIYRVDMPVMVYKITGESKDWDAWEVERTAGRLPGTMKKGLVWKDEERWKKVGK